jgi:hypothetical protein
VPYAEVISNYSVMSNVKNRTTYILTIILKTLNQVALEVSSRFGRWDIYVSEMEKGNIKTYFDDTNEEKGQGEPPHI